ncbi:hypothetical protein F4560_003944 [Saccharothrix ecbatanensis]|jgi:hypothetical protein|uniref:DUF6292 domain-containing protein n=1 Tax=Saccharothrix ecbatanensis TaxID=1105145 RepID=A0A7W9M1R0_9PSEU|nr:DUF6292 family protein [Saccharothrix ecbatanensis]MBB5804176.1 hypothetical protein [Saccharothrix ecbatanensis]
MDDSAQISLGLARYVQAVAEEVGVPPEGTEFEVSDTATAYLGLEGPGRDLMLLWSEHRGWSIAVETDPTEKPLVVAHLGLPLVPPPDAVAKFVDDVLAGKPGSPEPDLAGTRDRHRLANRLSDYL